MVEDEKSISGFIKAILSSNGFDVIVAYSGNEAFSMISSHCPDIVILDLGLPDMDGMQIIEAVRQWTQRPILVVSARSHERDKVMALEKGADDYITKPFEPLEVAAKVRAHLRRAGIQGAFEKENNRIEVGSLILDCDERVVINNGTTIELTKAEYKVLELFMQHPRRVFTKEQIYEYAWENEYVVDDNTIRVIISRLRDKIGDDTIKTIRGLGYRLETYE